VTEADRARGGEFARPASASPFLTSRSD